MPAQLSRALSRCPSPRRLSEYQRCANGTALVLLLAWPTLMASGLRNAFTHRDTVPVGTCAALFVFVAECPDALAPRLASLRYESD